jgi:uncharacterized MAPEG superfamily protein
MPTEMRLLAYSAILTWLMIVVASMLRSRGDLRVAAGNREAYPEQTALAGRAARAAANMLENMVLFVAVSLVVAGASGAREHHDRIVLGARMFFWARVAYWPVYLAGIPYLRTVIWVVSIAGMGLMLAAVL